MSDALPVQPSTVNVLALAPAERLTASMLASESVPSPVSPAAVSVKSTSADSTTVSVPAPPRNVSLPDRPANVLSEASPTIESSNRVPTTLRNPVIWRKPVAAPRARFTVTALAKSE